MTLSRVQKIQKMLKEKNYDAFLVEDPLNLFYLTACRVSAGQLLVTQDDARFFVDQRYFEKCSQACPLTVYASEKYSLAERLKPFPLIAFDSETMTYARYEELQTLAVWLPLKNFFKEQRMQKDRFEIDFLRQAAKLGALGYDFILSQLKEGIQELELALELEIFWKRNGGQGLAFDSIIAFGANSSMPHYRAGESVLRRGDLVLIDIGVLYQNYHSDMTRVVFFGDVGPEMQKVYQVVQQAQQAAIALCRPGTLIKDLDHCARHLIDAAGFEGRFTHSLGHGVGLEIHEFPPLSQKSPYADCALKPGMVITIEPGIYLPGKGGVRLEDTVVITENGHENLTLRPLYPYLYTT